MQAALLLHWQEIKRKQNQKVLAYRQVLAGEPTSSSFATRAHWCGAVHLVCTSSIRKKTGSWHHCRALTRELTNAVSFPKEKEMLCPLQTFSWAGVAQRACQFCNLWCAVKTQRSLSAVQLPRCCIWLHPKVQFGGFKLLFYKSLDPEEFQDESRQCGEWNSSNIAASCMILAWKLFHEFPSASCDKAVQNTDVLYSRASV